ncbi:hypothetical protein T440DRAFT_354765, partial [Plenodomus tracheiphilus IPT5]
GLPPSPRANRQMLSPLDTALSTNNATSQNPSPYSTASNSSSASTLVATQPPLRSHSSLIFVNATIPLSPASSASTASPRKERVGNPYDGLEPRKRSAFARLFCCFGREERARRRRDRSVEEFEKVGGSGHWSEW